MKTVYLIRHGHAEESELVCYRDNQVPLSEKGREQAGRLKDYLRDKNISAFYASPYRRAAETAEILAQGRAVRHEEALKEINMGLWQGKSFKEIRLLWPEDYEKRGSQPLDFRAPEGESFRDCLERAMERIMTICREAEGDVALVSHSGTIRVLLWALLHKEEQELFGIKQDFAAVNILKYDEKTEKLTAADTNLSV